MMQAQLTSHYNPHQSQQPQQPQHYNYNHNSHHHHHPHPHPPHHHHPSHNNNHHNHYHQTSERINNSSKNRRGERPPFTSNNNNDLSLGLIQNNSLTPFDRRLHRVSALHDHLPVGSQQSRLTRTSSMSSSSGIISSPSSSSSSSLSLPLSNSTSTSTSTSNSISLASPSTSSTTSSFSSSSSTTSSISNNNNNNKRSEGNRLQVLSFEQLKRLDDVMSQFIPLYSGKTAYPPIRVCLKDFVRAVKKELTNAGVQLRDIRLNGGTASYIISDCGGHTYNDYDFIFGVTLSHNGGNSFNQVKTATLDALMSFLPPNEREDASLSSSSLSSPSLSYCTNQRRRIIGGYDCTLAETYIQKLFRIVNDDPQADYWSLIGLGCGDSSGIVQSKAVELKFVERMRRPYEFTVDSFQIILDSLLTFYEVANLPITEHFYPTVVAESVAGSFQEALNHLHNKLIFTRNPEEIHGGGLLKYCRLLAEGYEAAPDFDMAHLERYMCSRFFIDYSDTSSQRARIESYLNSHFFGQYEQKIAYLDTLRNVIWLSTVCLMNQERYQTLHLVSTLIQEINYQQRWFDQHRDNQEIIAASFAAAASASASCNNVNFLCQDDIGAEDWTLDEIFYGTQYFPDLSATMSVVTNTPLSSSAASSPNQFMFHNHNNNNNNSILLGLSGDTSPDSLMESNFNNQQQQQHVNSTGYKFMVTNSAYLPVYCGPNMATPPCHGASSIFHKSSVPAQ